MIKIRSSKQRCLYILGKKLREISQIKQLVVAFSSPSGRKGCHFSTWESERAPAWYRFALCVTENFCKNKVFVHMYRRLLVLVAEIVEGSVFLLLRTYNEVYVFVISHKF